MASHCRHSSSSSNLIVNQHLSVTLSLIVLSLQLARAIPVHLADHRKADEQLLMSTEERLNQRTAESLSSVHDYELVVPSLVDHAGDFISYDVTDQYHVRMRGKRSIGLPPSQEEQQLSPEWIYYQLEAYGKLFHLNLTLNRGLISPTYSVEYVGKNGAAEKQHKTLRECHYYGYLNNHDDSRVALSNCHGLHGMFSTGDEDYFVEPLWNDTSHDRESHGHFHVVYKRSAIKYLHTHEDSSNNTQHCGVKDSPSVSIPPWWSSSTLPHSVISSLSSHNTVLNKPSQRATGGKHKWQRRKRRVRRSVSTERYVEMLVVADKQMVAYHGKGDIEPYVLTVMNIENLQITYHADLSLESFCLWQQSINPRGEHPGDEGVASHDNAVLITRYDICTYKNEPCGTLGLAPVAGMCEKDRSCSINEDIGLASAFTIAHEIGHNFGMQHDGAGNTCGLPGKEPAKIMAAQLTKTTEPFSWSKCSRDYITSFLDSGRGKCLENLPEEQDFDFPEEMPGVGHDADTQCQYQYGSRSRHCKAVEVCRELWCMNAQEKCVTNSIPAAEGTKCYFHENGTETGWCYQGKCEESGWRPKSVDGQWGKWSSWGDCTRTCGGGVESSERHCNKPRPEHGGRYCIGERKRYRSCNIHDCPINSTDFRELQCSKFNTVRFRGKFYKWKTFTGGAQVKPCALNCLAVGFNFYTERAPKVVDGTRCYPDSMDMCINGECRAVGCDRILGSNAVEDRCRVCGGDGNTCETIQGEFDKKLQKDSDSYEEVVVIPQGAVHIRIVEKVISRNYLALKSKKEDKYYINGAWTIDWPRKFEVANTIFHYERPKKEVESLYALGPTTEDLVIMILLQEENLGLHFEYNMAINNGSNNGTEFVWQKTPWSECSKSCATGISQSLAVCVRKDDGTMVKNKYCVPHLKPKDKRKYCNEEPCPAKWEIGEWSDCSKTCDGGVKERTVFCRQRVSQAEIVQLSAKQCPGKKPRSRLRCKNKKCPPHWATDGWSECRPACGAGNRTRNVYCVSSKGDYLQQEHCDAKIRPPKQQKCSKGPCPQPKWVMGAWGQCSSSCGKGSQQRNVVCRNHSNKPSNECNQNDKPPKMQHCQGACNNESTAENEVLLEEDGGDDECRDVNKVAYCPLVLKFKFCTRAYFRQMCCKTCTEHGF